ncbi:PQQ-dependent sugar dehydrogenase [Microbacterium sp.]|uniref:PQQ-dependent sugar dehydrogenase n=1 Tax=Microbacterium sp. TaxID=51671 RepID=UPI002B8BEC0F|nr:PQQ-dependent sugar dehydrogenase [Microbacterium sp.]HWK78175.1 PQQ-dependent sugar dehydrogenase [Microbacterium sp.]
MNARAVLGAAAAVAVLVLASCAPHSDVSPDTDAATPGATSAGAPTVVADGLDVPWSVAFFDDIPLVSERDTARIVELDDTGAAREVVVVPGVQPSGEGGLLGIAVRDDHLYAYFTSVDDNRIVHFPIEGGSGSVSVGDPETVLDGIPSAGNHNGGRIAFGPDGMLYATAGDAGDRPSAQDLDSLGGKILRMTPDGDTPADNPFPGSYVYSYGHRNPQGIAWDADGTMYASEFGQDTWDELNVIEAGGDYGWPEVEGIAEDERYIDPVQQWQPAEASPSGIAVAGGSIFIANLRGERLRQVPLDDLTASTELWTGEYGRLRDVVVAPDDALWVLTNNTDGRGSPGLDDDRIVRFDPAL